MMNTKINIDSKRMFLPLKMSKGTTEQRLQRARELNLQFYDNLQDKFVDRKISAGGFRNALIKTAGKRCNIDIENALFTHTPPFSHACKMGNANNVDTYVMTLPRTDVCHDTIDKSRAPMFLKVTQEFFNEILNPKFVKRGVALDEKALNSKAKNIKSKMEFYDKNIAGKNELSEKRLDNFLKRTPEKMKLDLLQHFRYKLLSEQNVVKAQPEIDKSIAKADNFVLTNKKYDIDSYKYDEKLALLNKKLAEILQTERAKNATKIKTKV